MTNETDVQAALRRVATALTAAHDHLTDLDQALGDGDLGVTTSKVAEALTQHADESAQGDLGTYLASGGVAVNRVASSTMGTLLATALMRAGKEVKGKAELAPADLVAMLHAAERGMQERGKAKLGDKTILDALHPAAEAFAAAVASGEALGAAGEHMLQAAQKGLEAVTPTRSRIGRAGWVGERTEGKVDPGCAALVVIIEGLLGRQA
ncbi:dihydroxyacetone kinase subunit DhaL [soil metagenome]